MMTNLVGRVDYIKQPTLLRPPRPLRTSKGVDVLPDTCSKKLKAVGVRTPKGKGIRVGARRIQPRDASADQEADPAHLTARCTKPIADPEPT